METFIEPPVLSVIEMIEMIGGFMIDLFVRGVILLVFNFQI
jgi:hypothetical protein